MNQPSHNNLRLPPQNLDAERGVLGSLMILPEAIDEIADVLKADHFYSDAHQKIYAAIRGLYENGVRGIDAVTLAEELIRREQFEEVGGPACLAEILDAVPHAAHMRYYASTVREKWMQRQLIYAATEMLEDAYAPLDADGIRDLCSQTEQRILAVCEQQFSGSRQSDLKEIMVRSFHRLDDRIQRRERGEDVSGIPSGFKDLDDHTTGFQPTELIILAARPSMGKTAFVGNMMERTARRGHRVLMFSLEQSNIELADRLMANVARVNAQCIRSGEISAIDRDAVLCAAQELSGLPIVIEDKPGMTIAEIASVSRRQHRSQALGLIIIDYLQLIEPEDKKQPREQQISAISRRLKCLAKELELPVVALAQLNRQVELRTDKRPKLADLRESGAIEQDADMVMFLHRPDAYDPEDRAGEAEIGIAKHRSGPTGTIRLTWRKESMRFEDYSPIPEGF